MRQEIGNLVECHPREDLRRWGQRSREETGVDRKTDASSNMTGGKDEKVGLREGGFVGLEVRSFYFLCKT